MGTLIAVPIEDRFFLRFEIEIFFFALILSTVVELMISVYICC